MATKKSKTYNTIYAKGYRAGYKKAQEDRQLVQTLAKPAVKENRFMDRVIQGFNNFMSPK